MNEDKYIENLLSSYGNRQAFRQKLNRIHDQVQAENGEVITTNRPPVARSKAMPMQRWWRKHRNTLAIAAVVAVVSTFGTILMYRSYQTSHQQQEQYSMLRRDIQAIQQSQRTLMTAVNSRRSVLRANPGQVAGSGFMLTADGYLVTNNHIVQDADSVYVQSLTGDVYKAKVVYTDGKYDLALLEIRDDSAFKAAPPIPYSFDARASDLGERVFTLGYPREEIVYGEGYLSSGTGYRGDTTAYQVAIGVNPGNSGGPLLDSQGNIIGIITGKQNTGEGVTFAVKTNYLFKALSTIPADSLRKHSLVLNRKNTLARLPRKQQIKRMQQYVYQVKVFKH